MDFGGDHFGHDDGIFQHDDFAQPHHEDPLPAHDPLDGLNHDILHTDLTHLHSSDNLTHSTGHPDFHLNPHHDHPFSDWHRRHPHSPIEGEIFTAEEDAILMGSATPEEFGLYERLHSFEEAPSISELLPKKPRPFNAVPKSFEAVKAPAASENSLIKAFFKKRDRAPKAQPVPESIVEASTIKNETVKALEIAEEIWLKKHSIPLAVGAAVIAVGSGYALHERNKKENQANDGPLKG